MVIWLRHMKSVQGQSENFSLSRKDCGKCMLQGFKLRYTSLSINRTLGLHKIFKPGNLLVIYQGWIWGLVIYSTWQNHVIFWNFMTELQIHKKSSSSSDGSLKASWGCKRTLRVIFGGFLGKGGFSSVLPNFEKNQFLSTFLMFKFLTENPACIHKRDCKYDHDEQDKYQGLESLNVPFPLFLHFVISES